MTQIFKVISQGEVISIPSQKTESGRTHKCNIVLQEFGGKYTNTYVATLLGNSALCKFFAGEYVVASLRFSAHEHNGQTYQDVVVDEIQKIKSM